MSLTAEYYAFCFTAAGNGNGGRENDQTHNTLPRPVCRWGGGCVAEHINPTGIRVTFNAIHSAAVVADAILVATILNSNTIQDDERRLIKMENFPESPRSPFPRRRRPSTHWENAHTRHKYYYPANARIW